MWLFVIQCINPSLSLPVFKSSISLVLYMHNITHCGFAAWKCVFKLSVASGVDKHRTVELQTCVSELVTLCPLCRHDISPAGFGTWMFTQKSPFCLEMLKLQLRAAFLLTLTPYLTRRRGAAWLYLTEQHQNKTVCVTASYKWQELMVSFFWRLLLTSRLLATITLTRLFSSLLKAPALVWCKSMKGFNFICYDTASLSTSFIHFLQFLRLSPLSRFLRRQEKHSKHFIYSHCFVSLFVWFSLHFMTKHITYRQYQVSVRLALTLIYLHTVKHETYHGWLDTLWKTHRLCYFCER